MQDWQSRIIEEKRVLDSKLESLIAFTTTQTFLDLPEADQVLLCAQQQAMAAYVDILRQRIARFERDR